jgi:hypothetical protein
VSCLSSWDFAQAARVLLEMAGNPQENLAGWAMLSLAKLAESNTQALPGLRNRLEEVAIPALRTAKDSDRRSAAALLAATGFVPGSGDAPDNEDGLLFAIARDDFAPLRQSGQAAVSSATLLHQSGRISDREKRAVLLAFPSADSVEQFCRDRDYEALGAVSKATREFDDKIQSVVERLLGHLKDADYYDEDVSKALISVGNPMAADSIRIALDRGMYEGNNSLQDSAGKFVNAHKRWCGPPETATCEICGRRKAVREMKFYTKEAPPGFGKYLWLWFCKGECWRLRGRVIGS